MIGFELAVEIPDLGSLVNDEHLDELAAWNRLAFWPENRRIISSLKLGTALTRPEHQPVPRVDLRSLRFGNQGFELGDISMLPLLRLRQAIGSQRSEKTGLSENTAEVLGSLNDDIPGIAMLLEILLIGHGKTTHVCVEKRRKRKPLS